VDLGHRTEPIRKDHFAQFLEISGNGSPLPSGTRAVYYAWKAGRFPDDDFVGVELPAELLDEDGDL
jgi:hypothetical protein